MSGTAVVVIVVITTVLVMIALLKDMTQEQKYDDFKTI